MVTSPLRRSAGTPNCLVAIGSRLPMMLIPVFTTYDGEAASTLGPALTAEQIGDIFQDPFTEIIVDDFIFTQDEGLCRSLITLTKGSYINAMGRTNTRSVVV